MFGLSLNYILDLRATKDRPEFAESHNSGNMETSMEARAPITPSETADVMQCDMRFFCPQNAPVVYPASSVTIHKVQIEQHKKGAKEPFESCESQCTTQSVTSPWPIVPASSISTIHSKIRPRNTFTTEQLNILEMTFTSCHYPSSVLRRQVAHACGLQVKTVQTWFQNRRARYRRKLNRINTRNANQLSSVKPSPGDPSSKASDHTRCSQEVLQQAKWSSMSVTRFSSPGMQAMWLGRTTPIVLPSISNASQRKDRSQFQGPSAYNQLVTDSPQPEFQVVYPPSEQALCQPANFQNFWILPEGLHNIPRSRQPNLMGRPLSDQEVSLGCHHLEQQQRHTGFSLGSWGETLPEMHLNSGWSQSYLPQLVTPTREFAPSQTSATVSQHNYKQFSPFYPKASTTIWDTNYPSSSQTSLASTQHQQLLTFPTEHLQMAQSEVTPVHYQTSRNNYAEPQACMLQSHSAASGYKHSTAPQQDQKTNIAGVANIDNYNSGFTSACPQLESSLHSSQVLHPDIYQGQLTSTSFQPGYTTADFLSSVQTLESKTSQLYPQPTTEPTTISCSGFTDQYQFAPLQAYLNDAPQSLPTNSHLATSFDVQHIPQENMALPGNHFYSETPVQPDMVAMPTIPQTAHQFLPGHALIPDDTILSTNDSVSLIAEPPTSPLSVSSFGSVKTLYIDLDADVD